MTRLEENEMVIAEINKKAKLEPVGCFEDIATFQLGAIAAMLGDISKSLAILANNTESKDGWIPVSERLPEEYKSVIVSAEYGVYPEARYSKEYGWEWAYEAGSDYWAELEGVMAWMPWPKPYIKKEEK